MNLVLDLTPQQERRLEMDAAREGLPLQDFALRRLLGHTSEELDELLVAADRKMMEEGLLSQIPPGIEPQAFRQFKPVPVIGKPVSETILEERH